MKRTRGYLLAKLLLVVLAVCMIAFPLVACDGDTNNPTGEKKTASYYCIVDGTEYTVSLEGTSFSLEIAGETKTGTFNLQDKTLVIYPEGGEKITATLDGDVLKLTYKGIEYEMLENKTFTVTFVLNGGTGTETATVKNGQKVTAPATPTKAGYVFEGWFTDAELTKPYKFDVNERGNVTLYAKFVEITDEEVYTATLMNGEENVGTMKTVNGKLVNLPVLTAEGKKFVGWWVSADGSKDKLSYKYDAQQIDRDVTLYAMWDADGLLVSVNATRISWTSLGNSARYSITVKMPNGEETTEENWTQNYYDYKMTDAGEYEITVSYRDNTATVYYRHMCLAEVKNFEVEGNTLKFAPVANAEGYKLTVTCENPDHDHLLAIDLGNKTSYDFSTCGMTEKGLTFVVEAYADGYASSYSEKYTLVRTLAKVEGLKADENIDEVTWNAVENATNYNVTIITSRDTVELTTSETKADLRAYSGNIRVTVVATAKCYNSSEESYIDLKKTKLATPSHFAFSAGKFTWEPVDGATGYVIKIGAAEFTFDRDTHSYTLTDEDYAKTGNADTAAVKAVGGTIGGERYADSDYTEELNFGEGALAQTLAYRNGKVAWNGVYGATAYSVKINGALVADKQAATSVNLTLEEKETTVEVCYYRGDKQSEWKTLNIHANKVTYVTGKEEDEYEYLTDGDSYGLPAITRVGYTFSSWMLDGESVGAGSKFTGGKDVSLVAQWRANRYTVTLDKSREDASVSEATKTVIYGEKYELPKAECADPLFAFAGWFTEPNGKGIQYTDYTGTSIDKYVRAGNCRLYAYYAEIFEFKLTNGDKEYAVLKGEGIGYVSEVKVPGKYNDKNVTVITSFADCRNITRLYLPDTVTAVEVGMDGGYTSGSAFANCANLDWIEMYHVEGAGKAKYKTENGILYKRLQDTDTYELAYYPKYREGAYVIPSYVVNIPVKALYQKNNLTELTVPSSVVKIGDSAFASCSKLYKITFMSDETAKEIAFGTDVFKSNSKLDEITLPDSIKEFSPTLFDGCSALQNVYISNNAKYKSINGVICGVNQTSGAVDTILYFPRGRDGEYTIPAGITAIGEAAFKSNTKLTKLTVPGYVTYIGKEAFRSCSGILELEFLGKANDESLTIEEYAFYGLSKIEELTLPENLKVMKAHAFGGTSKLRTLNLNIVRTVVEYAEYSFHNDASTHIGYLYYINIGKDTPKIDNFGNVLGSSSLKEVNVDENNQSYFSKDGVLFSRTLGENAEIEIVYFPDAIEGEYVIPETIEGKGTIRTIGGNVFLNKKLLTSVVIPKSVTQIGDSAFKGCNLLETVTFANADMALAEDGANALEIGTAAFQNCTVLKNITLPQRLVFIGDSAFRYCYALEEITVPKNVETLEETLASSENGAKNITRNRTFDYCKMLRAINVEEGNKNYFSKDGLLYKNNYDKDNKLTGSTLIICPGGKTGIADIDPSVEKIEAFAFYANENITEVVFSQGIKGTGLQIGEGAFNACKKLARLALPQGLTEIKAKTFSGCTSLQEVFIPKTVTFIGVDAFRNCTNLRVVEIEDGYLYKDTTDENGEVTREVINYLEIEAGKEEHEMYGNNVYYYGAFANCSSLTEITIPNRMKTVGQYAFVNTGLKTVNLSKDVEIIDYGAFYQNTSLKTVNFAENGSLKIIGEQAFYKSAIEEIVIPEGVIAVKKSAFGYNNELVKVTLPSTLSTITGRRSQTASSEDKTYTSNFSSCSALKTVIFNKDKDGNTALTQIGGMMFSGCYSLESIEIPKSVTYIGTSAFSSTKALKTITFEEGSKLESIDTLAFQYAALESIKFPKSVKTIGNSTFNECYNLKKVEFEEVSNLVEIGNTAFKKTGLTEFRFPKSSASGGISLGTAIFEKCTALTYVYMSESVSDIEGAFAKCSSITTMVISDKSENFKVSTDNAKIITNKDGTAIRYILGTLDVPEVEQKDKNGNVIVGEDGKPVTMKEFTLPSDIVEIAPNAFEGQTNLERIVIPASVQSVGKRAFANCFNLKEVVFAEGCTPTIGVAAFSGCYSLETVKMPTNLRANSKGLFVVNEQLFDGCRSLKNVTLPQNTTNIGVDGGGTGRAYTFRNCLSLKNITLPSALKIMGANVFEGAGLESIVIPASVTSIGGSNVFKNCKDLKTITFENAATITSLGGSTFEGCSSLKSVDLSAITKVTSLGSKMFKNCTSLTEVQLPGKVVSIGTNAFYGCAALQQISLPETVDTINAYAFYDSGLTSINIPAKVQVLGTSKTSASTSSKAYTFAECKNLKTVTFSSGSKCVKLGGYVFQNCESLEKINLKQFTQIGYYAFEGCTSLKEIDTSGVTTFSNFATSCFKNCTSLAKVTFSAKLAGIGTYAFEGCSSLREINLPAVTNLGVGCFKDCTSLKKITLNSKLTSLGAKVFQNCTSLTEITLPASLTSLGASVTKTTSYKTAIGYDNETSSSGTTHYGYTFAGCINLKKVTFGGSFVFIGYKVFAGCENLTDVKLPDTLKYLCSYAFEDTGIKEVAIGSAIEYVGVTPYVGCNIEKVASKNENIVVDGNGVVWNADKTVIYYYPADLALGIDFSKVDASSALNGNTTETEIKLEGVTEIGAKAFIGFKGLKKIVIPEGVTKIGDYAFAGCSGLTEIVLPSTLTEIGEYAFDGCTSLTAIKLPDTLSVIGEYAFRNAGLKSIVIPSALEILDTGVFQGSALESVTIPKTIKFAEAYVFQNSALKSVTFDLDLVATETINSSTGATQYSAWKKDTTSYTKPTFGTHMFEDCKNLTEVKFNGKFNWIADYMFANTASLTSFDFTGVKRIEANAFQGSALKEIVLPEDFYYFGAYAFNESAVEKVVINGYTSTSMPKYVFQDCKKLTYVDMRGLGYSLGGSMFANCSELTTVLMSDINTSVDSNTFANCTKIEKLYVSTATKLNSAAFAGWTENQTIYLVGSGRDFAATEVTGEFIANCNANLVIVDDYPAERDEIPAGNE